MTEDGMVGCHHRLNGHEFEETPGRTEESRLFREISTTSDILKLKLQYFDHLMGRCDSLKKTLMLGKTEGKRRRG